MQNLLNPDEHDDRTSCEACGATNLEVDEPCDCFDEETENTLLGGVLLREIPALSREEFYEIITEDPQYSGLVDPDDFEMILISTVLALDKKLQEALKRLGTPT